MRKITSRPAFLVPLVGLFLIAGAFSTLTACADNTISWREEVKLSDGRVIVVAQKKHCQGAYTGGDYANCIARETWLTINFPEFSPQPIVWHESLLPMILNIDAGRLYLVGIPPTGREFNTYGKPRPPYVGFVWENSKWRRIPFDQIPESIYDANMLLEDRPSKKTEHLTIKEKNDPANNGDRRMPKELKRIDPKYVSNFY